MKELSREQIKAKFEAVFCCSDDGRDVLDAILDYGGVGKELFAQDARVQDRNVAKHDFAVWICDMATKQTKEGKK
jgi:hypothetical protein